MQQVFHTWIWGSSAIPPCRSSPVLSGWMVNVGGQPFLGLSRDAQLGLSQALAEPFKNSHGVVVKPLLRYFSCVLRVIVLLEGKPSAQSEVLSTLEKVSSRISLYLAAFIFPSIATSRPVPAAEKHPHSMMLPPPCFTVGTVLDRWWAVPGFLHTYRLELRPKSSILVSSDQRILQVFFSKLHAGFHVSCTEERLPSGHSAIKPRLVEGGSDGWLSTTFSHLPNASLELSHSDLWVLLYLSHQGSSPPIAQFGRTASSRKGSGRPKRLPFKDYGGHCALRNLKCSIIFFVTLTRSVPCHNSVSELFRQFLWPHDSHLLWHALWAVRSYIDRCVAFLIKSNQYNQTQLDSNEGVEPSQGWSEEMNSTWVKYMSVTAKGLNT